jgi:hypothetical protein
MSSDHHPENAIENFSFYMAKVVTVLAFIYLLATYIFLAYEDKLDFEHSEDFQEKYGDKYLEQKFKKNGGNATIFCKAF